MSMIHNKPCSLRLWSGLPFPGYIGKNIFCFNKFHVKIRCYILCEKLIHFALTNFLRFVSQMVGICCPLGGITHTVKKGNEVLQDDFVRDETSGMVYVSNCTSHIGRLPNEILEKIILQVLSSSGFSWPNHMCQMYDRLCKVNVCFQEITSRLVWMLPTIHISSGGEPGIVSVNCLIKPFGCSSGLVQEIQQNNSCPSKLGECLAKTPLS